MARKNYDKLPAALQPPNYRSRRGYKNGIDAAIEYVENMTALPVGLKPRMGISYTAPKFVYGWVLSDEEFVKGIRAHPNFVVMSKRQPGRVHVDESLRRIRAHLYNDCRFHPAWRPRYESVIDLKEDKHTALAITDSYLNASNTPPPEVTAKVKELFGIEKEPRWYLHMIDNCWRERLVFRLPNGELEATTDF